MRNSRQLLTLMSILSLLMMVSGAAALEDLTPQPFAPVQDGFVSNADQVLPYAADRLLIQFTPAGMANSKLNIAQSKGLQVALAESGLESVDALALRAGVMSIERPYTRSNNSAAAAASGRDRWFMFRFDTSADMIDLARDFADDDNVESVTVDWRAFPAAIPNDPMYADQWGHDNTGQMLSYDWSTYSHENGSPVGTTGFDAHAQEAWDQSQGYGNSSVIIAILDSGVDVDHPDLNLIAGYDFGDNDTNPDDNSASPGHGTACAGVAAGSANNNLGVSGIAGGSSIMPCKIADSGGSMYFSYIQDALYWAADNGADVISMSFGAAISTDAATDAALLYAYNAGVTMFAATGNENDNVIGYPAINQYVISVGAASPCGDRKRSSSNTGELNPGVSADPNGYTCDGERWWGSNYGSTSQDSRDAVDLIAPTIMPTTDIGGSGGYDSSDYSMWFNGTSCSTPYAAGCAALIISANPTFTPAQVRDALTSTATDIVNVESGSGWDRYSGYGMVNIDAALGGGGPVAPVAAFSGAPVSGTYPLNVTFSDASSGVPTSWSWTFGDGGTSSLQNPSYTYNALGTYTVSLSVSNAQGNDTDTKVGYITVTEPGATAYITADGETSVASAVTGSYIDTKVSDGINETISEVAYTGHPRKTYSYAEHMWSFTLPGGDTTFHLEASRSDNSENDNFVFDYTTDGVNYVTLATVSSSSEQTFSVPVGNLSGAVTVRVVDTDRNWDFSVIDNLFVDYMSFEVGDVQPVAPTADFAGTPVSGEYPLNVSFTDASSGDPTSWSWTFGDGGTSTAQNPSYTYTAAGSYTVSLTATNAQGSDTNTKTGYITVTEPGVGATSMFVNSMTVGRVKSGPNYLGSCDVVVFDNTGSPVSGATVTASYDGPSNGSVSGTTAADGSVNLLATGIKRPTGEWCFEVTNVTHATLSYDAASNVTTRSCEGGDVFSADQTLAAPLAFALSQNNPNPFNPMTDIKFDMPRAGNVVMTVYNVRGQAVVTLVNQRMGAGSHTVTWDARKHNSGVYFYRIETPGFSETRKMILVK